MISTLTAADQRIGEGGRRADDEPDGEGNQSHHDDGGHEDRRHPVGEALDRGARALRLGNHGDDAREGGLGAGAVDLHVEAAGGVLRAAGDAVAFVLLDRDRLAGDERLVDRASAVDDDAIDRHPVAGAHAQHVTDHDVGERHLGRVAVRLDLQRRLGREVEEGADCTAGLRPRPEFQHLAEEDEGGDHRRRLEIDADQAVMVAHLGRKDLRREHRDQAVDERRADADGNQREHVEVAGTKRIPAADEERPAAPEHRRYCDGEL